VNKLNNYKVYELDEKLRFGKYEPEGLTLRKIIEKDPEYVRFCLDKLNWFFISDGSKKLLNEVYREGLEK